MSEALVSVIVPIYNVEPYIKKCVDSILSQTYTNLEIILVDDGSPDDCPAICDEYAKKDSRVVVIHKQNGGLSEARNAGLDIMKGDYVVFVDGDDWVGRNYVKNLYDLISLTNSSIAITSMTSYTNIMDCHTINDKSEIKTFSSTQACENSLYGIYFDVSASAKLFKKELFFELRFPVGKIYEDLYLMPQILYRVDKVCFCECYDYFYLKRSDSTMRESFSLRHMFMCQSVLELYDLIGNGIDTKALEYRLFHSYVCVAQKLILSNEYKKYSIVFNTIKKEIKSNLLKVIFDKKASKIAILKALAISVNPSIFLKTYIKFKNH